MPAVRSARCLPATCFTLFIYWELLAVTSAILVFARRTELALSAGMRYLVIQVGSGVLLLAGAILYAVNTGSLAFDHIGLDAPGGWLIFLAFGIKSAFPMLHGWLTDATRRRRRPGRYSSAPSPPRSRSTRWHAALRAPSCWSTSAP